MKWLKRRWLALWLWLAEEDLKTVEELLLGRYSGPLTGFESARWEAEEFKLRLMRSDLRCKVAALHDRIEALR